jgi:hypothetical protein
MHNTLFPATGLKEYGTLDIRQENRGRKGRDINKRKTGQKQGKATLFHSSHLLLHLINTR